MNKIKTNFAPLKKFRYKFIIIFFTFLISICSIHAKNIIHVKSILDKDKKDIVHHSGDLIVECGETYLIENVKLSIEGNIFVKNNATLKIENSDLILESIFFTQYNVELSDNAKFIAENSTLGSWDMKKVMFIVKEANVQLINTIYEWQIHADGGNIFLKSCKSTSNPIFFKGGKIYINNSDIYVITIPINNNKKSSSEFNNLHPGFNKHIIIERNDGKKHLELTNTSISGWILDVGDAQGPTYEDLVVKNSILDGIWFWFHANSSVEINGLELGYFSYWRMQEEWNLKNVDYDVKLVNTTINDLYKLQILGNALIENVSGTQVAPRGSSFIYVKNSRIEPNLVLRGNEYVIIEDTEIFAIDLEEDTSILENIIRKGGNHYLELRNTKIFGSIEIASNFTIIRGDFMITSSIEDINWAFGIVEREFPVFIECNGNPCQNASLYLIDPNGKLIWGGITDKNGCALFNVTFTKENYAEKFSLDVEWYNRSISKNIYFLKNTPLIISLGENSLYGHLKDWGEISPLVVDAEDDSLVEHGDLKSIYVVLKDNYLYIMVEMYDEEIEEVKPPLIEIDVNLDEERDYIVGIDKVENINTHESYLVESAFDNFIEYKVPIQSIGNPLEFNIGAHITYRLSENRWAAADAIDPRWTFISRKSSIYMNVSSAQINFGENISASGKISISHKSVPIILTYQMPNGSILVRNVVTASDGSFNDTFRPIIQGIWRVKANWEGDLDYIGSNSSWYTFMVVSLLKQAEFNVSNLIISPDEVQRGRDVKISVEVVNIGEASGECELEMRINGIVEASKIIEISSGANKMITFEISRDAVGTYQVDVSGLKGEFTVTEINNANSSYQFIILLLTAGLLLILFYFRKKIFIQ